MKREHDVLLAAEVRQSHGPAAVASELEIRRFLSWL
jgi:hypothetical protein